MLTVWSLSKNIFNFTLNSENPSQSTLRQNRKIVLEKGAKVAAIIHKSGLEEIKSLGSVYGDKISTHIANLANKDDVEKLPEEIIAVHGCIDGIINNTGILLQFHSVDHLDYEQIQKVMDVNFYGTLYMCKSFLPHLLNRPEAHITNVSSMGGFLPAASIDLLSFKSSRQNINRGPSFRA